MRLMAFFLCAVCASGCATAGTDVLPRVIAGAEAAKASYRAACEPVPAGAEKVCADLKTAIDKYDAISGDVLKVLVELLKPESKAE